MGTTFAEVLTNYFLTIQNDERLTLDLSQNPAQTFRRLYLYMKSAVPMFSRPPQAQEWLQYTSAEYGDYSYKATEAQPSPVTISTNLIGYDICSAGIVSTDTFGRVLYTPVDFSYDAQTGIVTVNQNLNEGQNIEIDVYTDAFFIQTLPERMKQILGLCVQYVWEMRYAGDYLSRTPKAIDKSSKFANENEKVKADTGRMQFLKTQLDGEMYSFEQSIFSTQKVPIGNQPTIPN